MKFGREFNGENCVLVFMMEVGAVVLPLLYGVVYVAWEAGAFEKWGDGV